MSERAEDSSLLMLGFETRGRYATLIIQKRNGREYRVQIGANNVEWLSPK
jgi:hypothetical protein